MLAMYSVDATHMHRLHDAKEVESTVAGSGYRLPENREAYGRTPHASQLIES